MEKRILSGYNKFNVTLYQHRPPKASAHAHKTTHTHFLCEFSSGEFSRSGLKTLYRHCHSYLVTVIQAAFWPLTLKQSKSFPCTKGPYCK